jgi:hypothetical protein
MSSLYVDNLYNSLDFISQATEPFLDNVQNLLASLPNKIPIEPQDISSYIYLNHYNAGLNERMIIGHKIEKVYLSMIGIDYSKYATNLTDFITSENNKFLKLEIEPGTEINSTNGECSKPIFLVKKNDSVPSEDIAKYALAKALHSYKYYYFYYSKDNDLARVKELCEIFEVDKSLMKTRNPGALGQSLCDAISHNVKNDTYRIRTYDMLVNIGKWCRDYVNDKDMASYTNITRFKLMTHSGRAIYSIEETL